MRLSAWEIKKNRSLHEWGDIMKYLLVMVLNKTEFLREILKELEKLGLKGATIFDSLGAGRVKDIKALSFPMIGGVKRALENAYLYNNTVISVVDDRKTAVKMAKAADRIVGGFKNPGTGIVFVLPLDFVLGGAFEDDGDVS
jgi:nitrogen regulatory protein P-II 1